MNSFATMWMVSSFTTAAIIGSFVGGLAVGGAAGVDAEDVAWGLFLVLLGPVGLVLVAVAAFLMWLDSS